MPSPSARPEGRALFSRPGASGFLAVAMLARLSYATVGFALLLLLEQVTGSYAVAGAGLVGYGLTGALLAPVRGRLVDRWGRVRALPLLAAVSAVLFTACAVLAAPLGDSPVALVALTTSSGCFLPPLGPVTRGVWAAAAADDDERRAAYSLDTVAEEGLFTVGPVLVGLIVAVSGPRAAVLLTAALMLAGTLAMVRSRLLVAAGDPSADDPDEGRVGQVGSPLKAPGFLLLLAVLFGAGLGLGGVELAMVAFADARGGPARTGAVLAVLGLASALGGAAYGTREWAGSAPRHLLMCCLALAAALGLLALASRGASLPLFTAAAFLMGLFVAPLIVTAYTCADDLVVAGARTQASTLVGTLNNLGTAAGTAATGLLVDRAGTGAALFAAGGVMLLAGVLASGLRQPGSPQGGAGQ